MKTRQEMIYDFMLALAPTWGYVQQTVLKDSAFIRDEDTATEIWENACALANAYLETNED